MFYFAKFILGLNMFLVP